VGAMKTNYLELHMAEEAESPKLAEELVKPEDPSLPEFVKDIPSATKKSISKGSVSIVYSWTHNSDELLKIKRAEFDAKESLDNLYRLNEKDGVDRMVVMHNSATYLFRKTSKEVAISLYNAFSRLKGTVEKIVGYIQTLLGNFYTISRVEQASWVFDKTLALHGNLHSIDCNQFDQFHKDNLVELIVEKMTELHSHSMIMRNFSLNNIMLTNDSLVLTDLRDLRLSRKKSLLVEEFRKVLGYLASVELLSSSQSVHAVTHYYSAMEKPCEEWYTEKTGKKGDSYKIATAIEKAIGC
jgi:hypothetical protein